MNTIEGVKKETPRAKMLEVARRLFWEKGYQATSIRDIARAYGCKPANIYNFFSDKEEILFEVLRDEMQEILDPIIALEQDEDQDPKDQLRKVIENHLSVTLSYRRSAKLLFDVALDSLSHEKRNAIVAMRDRYDHIIRKVIERGIRKGAFIETDPKIVGILIASMITRTRLWFHPEKGLTTAQLSEFICQFVLKALSKDSQKT